MYKPKNKRIYTEAYFIAFRWFCELISSESQREFLGNFEAKYSSGTWKEAYEDEDLLDPTFEHCLTYPSEFFQFISIDFPQSKVKPYKTILEQGIENSSENSENSVTKDSENHFRSDFLHFREESIKIIDETLKIRKKSSKL